LNLLRRFGLISQAFLKTGLWTFNENSIGRRRRVEFTGGIGT